MMRCREWSGSGKGRKGTWAVLLVLAASGCGRTEDPQPSLTVPDSAHALPAVPLDTSSLQPVSGPESALRSALEQLLGGPTDPRQRHTWFSARTADALQAVSVDS